MNWMKAQEQQELAKTGQAENQCQCGSYRIDGRFPVLHHYKCPNASKGFEAGLQYMKEE